MASGGGFDWDLDLTPMRPTTPTARRESHTGDPSTNGASLDIVAALSDLKRSVDRLSQRIGRIERAIDAAEADPSAAKAATQRLRTVERPAPAAAEDTPTPRKRRRSGDSS